MEYLRVKNFDKLQHYRDRCPPWIKLYNSLLDNYVFISLSVASRYHYISLLLLASRLNNRIPHDKDYISKMLHTTDFDSKPLLDSGMIAICKQNACPEESRGEQRRGDARGFAAAAHRYVAKLYEELFRDRDRALRHYLLYLAVGGREADVLARIHALKALLSDT